MTIASAELAVQRAITKAFIDADWDDIVLQDAEIVNDGAGGVRRVLAPREPQRMRLSPVGTGVERKLEDGTILTSSHTLLGEWNASMERGDSFSLRGRKYLVIFVNENRQYQVKGEVTLIGSEEA